MIISNSSPLIHLAKLGKILPLLDVYGKILIPQAVYNETIMDGLKRNYSEAIFLENLYKESLIEVRRIQHDDSSLKGYLHPGEYEALQLALETKLPLVIDDKKARNVASMKNIDYRSTMQLILDLLDARAIDIDHFKRNLRNHAGSGWISKEVLAEYLAAGNEVGRGIVDE